MDFKLLEINDNLYVFSEQAQVNIRRYAISDEDIIETVANPHRAERIGAMWYKQAQFTRNAIDYLITVVEKETTYFIVDVYRK